MNQKRAYRPPADVVRPTYLHQLDVDIEVRGKIRTVRLTKGTVVSVRHRPNLPRGQYVFQYAEEIDGTLLIYADQFGKRKTLRITDITAAKGGI